MEKKVILNIESVYEKTNDNEKITAKQKSRIGVKTATIIHLNYECNTLHTVKNLVEVLTAENYKITFNSETIFVFHSDALPIPINSFSFHSIFFGFFCNITTQFLIELNHHN